MYKLYSNSDFYLIYSDEELDALAKKYHRGSVKEVFENTTFKKTFEELNQSIKDGYGTTGYDESDTELVWQLTNNTAVFSAFKSYRQNGEILTALVDQQGNKKSFNDFKKDFEKIDANYNKNYLRAEYNMAQRQSQAAKNWNEFQKTKDLYPNIEYIPSRSAEPRQSHQQYYGIIRPIDDPIWNTLWPPLEWGCKCSVSRTNKEEVDKPVEMPLPTEGVSGNAGKAKQVFSSSHPYVKGVSPEDKKEIATYLRKVRDKEFKGMYVEQTGSQGKMKVHYNADGTDLAPNIRMGEAVINKYKGNFEVRAHSNKKGVKNPEFRFKNVVGDMTTWKASNSVDKYIQSSIKNKVKAEGQLSSFSNSFIAFDFNGKLSAQDLTPALRVIKGRLNQSKRIKFFVLKNNEKVMLIDKVDDFETTLILMQKELL